MQAAKGDCGRQDQHACQSKREGRHGKGVDHAPGANPLYDGRHDKPREEEGQRSGGKKHQRRVEDAFQKKKRLKLGMCHSQAFIDGKFTPPVYSFDNQYIGKVQQSDAQQSHAYNQSGKDRIQPAGGEIFLIFAAAGDSYATVQSLFIGVKISFKRLLAAMIDADSGLTHTLVRKQPVKGGEGHIIIDTEGSLRTVGAA